jgi:hypothetical protein
MKSIFSAAVIEILMLAAFAAIAAESTKPQQQLQTYYLFVFSNPAAGMEVQYNKWYDEQHAPDVVSVPDFVTAQRFEFAEQQMRPGSPSLPKYLVLYKIVTNDLKVVYSEVSRRISAGETKMSDAVDQKSFLNRTYRVIRPELSSNANLTGKAASGKKQVYCQFVFGEAKAGQDKEFNDWYDHHHAQDILSVPGFIWGQRMKLNDVQMSSDVVAQTYLMMFRIETGDLAATLEDFKAQAHKMSDSPAFDGARTFGYTYKAIGRQLDGDKVRASRRK